MFLLFIKLRLSFQEAIPVIKEKFNQASDFVNDEIVPEVKKVFDAGVEGHRRVFTDENGDTVIKQTENWWAFPKN